MALAMVTTMAPETMIAREVTTLDQATMALAMVTIMAPETMIAREVTTLDQATMALAMVTIMAPETIKALALVTTTALAQDIRGSTYISYGCMSSFEYGSDWINKL